MKDMSEVYGRKVDRAIAHAKKVLNESAKKLKEFKIRRKRT